MRALALAAAAAPGLAGAPPAAPPTQVKHTTGFVEALAISGNTLAYDVDGDQPRGPECNRVFAWNLSSGRVTRVSGRGTCDANASSTGAGVARIAIAGARLAWIANTGGNTESVDRLFTASLPRPHERKLATVRRTGEIDCVMTGRALGGLVGASTLLAYNIWTVVAPDPANESSCATKSSSGSLRRIAAGGTLLLRSGPDTLVAEDAAGSRIAVVHDDGTVELFRSNGSPLRTISVEPPKEVALAGDRLLVLTRTRRIQVYSASTGRPGATRTVPAGTEHLAASGRVAAYAANTKLHVLRLASGRDSVVATAPRGIVAVAVSGRALAYAFNVFKRGRTSTRDIGNVVAIPLSRLRR